MSRLKELSSDELSRKVPVESIDWKYVKEKHPLRPIIGQGRALEALEFGIGNKSRGFNIYVSGYPGSGKHEAVNHYLQEKAKSETSPGDWCYVNNFKDPYFPKGISLPQGGAEIFKDEIKNLIDEAHKALIKAFESKEYDDKRQNIINGFQQREIELFKGIQKKAGDHNFAIRRTPIEILVIPVNDAGEPIIDQKFHDLNKEKKDEIIKKQAEFKNEVKSLLRKNRDLDRARNHSLIQLEKNVALYAIESLLDELHEKYKKFNDVLSYLEDIKLDIIEHLGDFLNSSTPKGKSIIQRDPKFTKYKVNVITNNAHLKGAPIVIESNPTYNNLFGKVEHESAMGTLITNFTLIRGGALHKANGGYLILPLKELLLNYFSWDSLKRALNNNEIVIEDANDRFGFLSTKSLKPDPIPLNIQIILIGSPILYYLLYQWDEDFKELFKVKAEFDTTMDYSDENIKDFIKVIYKIEAQNDLLPLDTTAISSVVEQASRMADDRNKMSIRFGEISDILQEANHYARQANSKKINSKHIRRAVEAKYFRSNLIQIKVNEMIKREKLMISLSGSAVGQINGLSVIDLGDISFGKPNKITVSVASGKDGLIDIEREAKLSGSIHTKGVLILMGYLREKYGQNKPISLVASLVFEQSYSEIEGDSASSAELYAIVSGLSKLPLKQGIAVTGSVNQKGEIQPVGAINEKIEGYFEVCKQLGLNGEQGVIIPKNNVENLMLKEEVVQAVKEEKFHVWAIGMIDEGIEILTGKIAGQRLKNKSFTKDSVHYLVDKRIDELNKNLKQYSNKK